MQKPRQVPGIAQGPKQFAPDNRGPIQSPLMMPSQQSINPIAEQIHNLTLEIYAQLAVDHIGANQTINPQMLQELAQSAHLAALAFFQQLQFDEAKPNG